MRLIDADALCAGLVINHPVVIHAKNAPTVDAVPVVRCKDCRWHEDEEPGMVWCSHIVSSWMEEEDFCSMGKRMDEVEG